MSSLPSLQRLSIARRLSPLLLALALAACGPTTPEASEPAAATPSAPASAAPQTAAPDMTFSAGEAVVVAKVVDAGPIGDGNCSQRSYRISIERVTSGDIIPGSDPISAHFESCADHPAPAPGPGELVGTSLDVGSTYELSLRRGASANFGIDFMILKARPAPR